MRKIIFAVATIAFAATTFASLADAKDRPGKCGEFKHYSKKAKKCVDKRD